MHAISAPAAASASAIARPRPVFAPVTAAVESTIVPPLQYGPLFVGAGVAGMALTTSCFSMIGSMFGIASAMAILVSIVAAGLVCIVISTSIAELASMYPSAPGVRTYLKMAFGDYT